MSSLVLLSICFFNSITGRRIIIHPKSKIQIKNLHPRNLSAPYDINDYQQNTPWSSTDFCSSFYLSPLFSNDMILQRGSPGASIFGWGKVGASVTMEFNGQNFNT